MSDGIGADVEEEKAVEEEKGEAIAVNAAEASEGMVAEAPAEEEIDEAHDNATAAESIDTNGAVAHSVSVDPLFFDVFPTNELLKHMIAPKDEKNIYMKLTMMGCQKLCCMTETVGHSQNATTWVGASIKAKSCCLQILHKVLPFPRSL